MNTTGEDILRILSAVTLPAWRDEEHLHRHLDGALVSAGLVSFREYRLADGKSRVDIFVPAHEYSHLDSTPPRGIAIEVKVKGSPGDVLRQLERYARCSDVLDLVLVTTKATHLNVMPPTIDYKPLIIVPLLEGGL